MTHLLPGESIVKTAELTELRAKARNHDIYLRATRRMRERLTAMSDRYGDEYAAALNDFAELIVEEGRNG